MTAQEIRQRRQALSDSLTRLEEKISNQKAKDALLRQAKFMLGDIDDLLLPWAAKAAPGNAHIFLGMAEFNLAEAERHLKHAQDLIASYGADLEAI